MSHFILPVSDYAVSRAPRWPSPEPDPATVIVDRFDIALFMQAVAGEKQAILHDLQGRYGLPPAVAMPWRGAARGPYGCVVVPAALTRDYPGFSAQRTEIDAPLRTVGVLGGCSRPDLAGPIETMQDLFAGLLDQLHTQVRALPPMTYIVEADCSHEATYRKGEQLISTFQSNQVLFRFTATAV